LLPDVDVVLGYFAEVAELLRLRECYTTFSGPEQQVLALAVRGFLNKQWPANSASARSRWRRTGTRDAEDEGAVFGRTGGDGCSARSPAGLGGL